MTETGKASLKFSTSCDAVQTIPHGFIAVHRLLNTSYPTGIIAVCVHVYGKIMLMFHASISMKTASWICHNYVFTI